MSRSLLRSTFALVVVPLALVVGQHSATAATRQTAPVLSGPTSASATSHRLVPAAPTARTLAESKRRPSASKDKRKSKHTHKRARHVFRYATKLGCVPVRPRHWKVSFTLHFADGTKIMFRNYPVWGPYPGVGTMTSNDGRQRYVLNLNFTGVGRC
jgi:hypothetical protein